jgi:hypothetical protein
MVVKTMKESIMIDVLTKEATIPANRRLQLELEVPDSWTESRAIVQVIGIDEFSPTHPIKNVIDPLLAMRGSCKGRDTLDAYFARHHAENAAEAANEQRQINGEMACRNMQ